MERSEAYFHARASVDESNFNFKTLRVCVAVLNC